MENAPRSQEQYKWDIGFQDAAHLSSGYHQWNDWLHNAATGGYCNRDQCNSPYHVNPRMFWCVNPHCQNPAHFTREG